MELPSKMDEEYKTNVRVITFLVSLIVVLLTIIFLIKTYTDIRQNIIENMKIEADRLESLLIEEFEYTTYILDIMAREIKGKENDYEFIYDLLKSYNTNIKINNIFGWTIFSWSDKNLITRVLASSPEFPLNIDISNNSNAIIAAQTPNKVYYGAKVAFSPYSNKNIIPVALGIADNNNNFKGLLAVGISLSALTKKLYERRKHDHTNFALIDKRLNAIIKSKSFIPKIGIEDNFLVSHHLLSKVKKISFFSDESNNVLYLDMMKGANFYIRKLKNLPFMLLINIDYEIIKDSIMHKVLIKFFEIATFSSFFLALIISIYRRETWLRTEAEKASEIAIKAMESKSEFLAFTAHEIRSPLGFIITGSEIVIQQLMGPISKPYKEYLIGINQNAHLILDFIDDILDDSKTAEGNFKINNSINDLIPVIEKAIIINKTRFNDRLIFIKTDIAENIPKVICDPKRILQAIDNLISNSIKYSRDHTVVTVKLFQCKGDLYLSVIDQGIGMTLDEIKIAFKKYGTVDKKHIKFNQSYGLGLPIVKKLAEAHGARIKVTSKMNEGTTVSIIFPEVNLIPSAEYLLENYHEKSQ